MVQQPDFPLSCRRLTPDGGYLDALVGHCVAVDADLFLKRLCYSWRPM